MVSSTPDPGIPVGQFQFSPAGTSDLVVGRGATQEIGDGDAGVPMVAEQEVGDVEAGEVHAIVQSVFVLGAKLHLVPGIKLEREENIQFKMNVGPFSVDASACITHSSEGMSDIHALAFYDGRAGKVRIEAQERSVSPVVLDDYVFPVVTSSGTLLNVDNASLGNGFDVIEGISGRISLDRADIDPLVEAGGDNPPLNLP